MTKQQKKAIKELTYCVDYTGSIPSVPFHKNWAETIFEVLPNVSFAGWGDRYDGGTIIYRNKKGFLGPEEIKKALWLVYKLQRPLTKKEIYCLSTQEFSGCAERCAQLGII
ncbi:MAG: hypothetical protein ACFWT2_11800 [Thermoanaerobacterium thermosaccharolyticum]|jgi:hypothetical protein